MPEASLKKIPTGNAPVKTGWTLYGRRRNLTRERSSGGNTAGKASRRPLNTPKDTRNAAAKSCRLATTPREKPQADRLQKWMPEAGESPEKGPKLKAVQAGESDFGPVHKSSCGTDGSHGTARLRGQNPEAASNCPTEPKTPRSKSRGGQMAKRHVGSKRSNAPPPARREQHCEEHQNPNP